MCYIEKSHDLTYVVIVPHLLRSRAIYFEYEKILPTNDRNKQFNIWVYNQPYCH